MPLDVAILNSDGNVMSQVSLSTDIHAELMSAASCSRCWLLLRMCDYYREITYEHAELPVLLDELGGIISDPDSPVLGVAIELQQLVSRAIAMKHTVHVLPD
jgi:hypothetical protein